MSIPKPDQGEGKNEFIIRFIASEAMQKEFPEEKQRAAVDGTWEASLKKDDLQAITMESITTPYKSVSGITMYPLCRPDEPVSRSG